MQTYSVSSYYMVKTNLILYLRQDRLLGNRRIISFSCGASPKCPTLSYIPSPEIILKVTQLDLNDNYGGFSSEGIQSYVLQ